jgi:hypothetical protein
MSRRLYCCCGDLSCIDVRTAAELVPAFVAAATQLIAHLKQQQSQQKLKQSQQQQARLLALAAAMLHMWGGIGCACTLDWVLAVLPSIGPAAELALLALTGPHGGIAPNADSPAFTMHGSMQPGLWWSFIGYCTSLFTESLEAEAHHRPGSSSSKRAVQPEEAVLASDVVQRALILQAAVFVYAGWQVAAAAAAASSKRSQQQQQRQEQQQQQLQRQQQRQLGPS